MIKEFCLLIIMRMRQLMLKKRQPVCKAIAKLLIIDIIIFNRYTFSK